MILKVLPVLFLSSEKKFANAWPRFRSRFRPKIHFDTNYMYNGRKGWRQRFCFAASRESLHRELKSFLNELSYFLWSPNLTRYFNSFHKWLMNIHTRLARESLGVHTLIWQKNICRRATFYPGILSHFLLKHH